MFLNTHGDKVRTTSKVAMKIANKTVADCRKYQNQRSTWSTFYLTTKVLTILPRAKRYAPRLVPEKAVEEGN